MKLLYLAIAYMVGVTLGRFAWAYQWINCQSPETWLWLVFIALIPLPFLFDKPTVRPASTMRWPKDADFSPPHIIRPYALWVALCLALLAGTVRYASHPITPCWTETDLAFYNLAADEAFNSSAPQVTVRGYISNYPLFADTQQKLNVWVQAIKPTDSAAWLNNVEGEITLKVGALVRYSYGQQVELRGRLVTPNEFEDFSYREYLARKNIHSLFNIQGNGTITPLEGPNLGARHLRAIYAVRTRGEALLNQVLPEPHAGLANGMLLGIEAGIDDDLYEKFNLTGTSHVIVISGSNVAIISAVFLAIGARLVGRRRAMWPALIGIGCYALLVGGDGAVMRAALMGAVYVVATSLGRRNTALVSLAFACWVLTLVNPLTLWDVGFQLSSAATAGLIVYANGISDFFTTWWRNWSRRWWQHLQASLFDLPLAQLQQKGRAKAEDATLISSTQSFMGGLIQEGLLITIAANITTLPLVVYYFDRLSVVSLLTNLLISAVQPYIMLWGSGGLVVGVLGTYLSDWLNWIETGTFWLMRMIMTVPLLCLQWTTIMVEWTAALPFASLLIEWYALPHLIGTYALLGLHRWFSTLSEQSRWRATLNNALSASKVELKNSVRIPTAQQ